MENARQRWSLGDPGGMTLETPIAVVGQFLGGFFFNG
jgi:hypothetical protein